MSTRESGITRIDLLAVLGALSLVALLAAPSIGASSGASKRVACQNNLRQVLSAFHLWMDGHREIVPWVVLATEGGTRPSLSEARNGAVWLEMSVLSNYLSSPRILSCPADPTANPAENWGAGAGGLLNSGHRANAVSYILGTDALPMLPRSVLTGDRDFSAQSGLGSCSRGFNNIYSISSRQGTLFSSWTNLVHSTLGNLGFFDGSVEAVPSSRLASAFNEIGVADDAGSTHYLQPR